MNCHTAQRLIATEPDSTPSAEESRLLAAHLSGCEACRNEQTIVARALAGWQASTASAAMPTVERAWQDIQRELRKSSGQPASRGFLRRSWMIPVSAAAALAALIVVARPLGKPSSPGNPLAQNSAARADFVEVPNDASSLVYVDDQSGWLVVWAVNDSSAAGG